MKGGSVNMTADNGFHEIYELQALVIEQMFENSKVTGFESVTTHALGIILNRYTGLLFEHAQQQAEIERLKGDNRRLHVICDERAARASDYLRAYEELYKATMHCVIKPEAWELIREAQRIKDGEEHGNTA